MVLAKLNDWLFSDYVCVFHGVSVFVCLIMGLLTVFSIFLLVGGNSNVLMTFIRKCSECWRNNESDCSFVFLAGVSMVIICFALKHLSVVSMVYLSALTWIKKISRGLKDVYKFLLT